MKRKTNKKITLFIIIILLTISVGFAAMSRTLNVTGNSKIIRNTWDIHFENIEVTEGSVTAETFPTIDNSKLAVNYAFDLNLPGDFYEFTVDVVNDGSIDAMIETITKTPELTDSQKKYLNYTIEYQNGEQITSKQLVSRRSFVRFKVRVEYKNDVAEADLPTANATLNLGFTVNYIQRDKNATYVNSNGALIKFKIDGKSYIADYDMQWSQWTSDPKYNVDGFRFNGEGYLVGHSNCYAVYYPSPNLHNVDFDEIIIDNVEYVSRSVPCDV